MKITFFCGDENIELEEEQYNQFTFLKDMVDGSYSEEENKYELNYCDDIRIIRYLTQSMNMISFDLLSDKDKERIRFLDYRPIFKYPYDYPEEYVKIYEEEEIL